MRPRTKAYLYVAVGLGVPAAVGIAAFLRLLELRRQRPEEIIEGLGLLWLFVISQPWILAFSFLAYANIRRAHAERSASGSLLEVLEIVIFALPVAAVVFVLSTFLVMFISSFSGVA
jgi:hypothetical protein